MKNDLLILVLDDDPDICTMIKIMLEYNDYKVAIAEKETDALAILGLKKVDLLVMDMLLSGSDGTDLCRRLKQEPATASLPVLMFSAHPHAREICIAAGADDFIPKPFEINDMLSKIALMIKRAKDRQQ